MASSILVTATGCIESIVKHTAIQLLNQGFKVTILHDNPHNSVEEETVRRLVLPHLSLNLRFHLGDFRNKEDLEKLFSKAKFDAVVHFAGLKDGDEKMGHPFRCVNNSLMVGLVTLCQVMFEYGCKKLVFSYSADVCRQPKKFQDFELKAVSPYGRTKLFREDFARDIHTADPEWKVILLKCFNPAQAHENWKVGKYPVGIADSVLLKCFNPVVSRLQELNVYRHDYPTKYGTAVRDYIHAMDLADGHIEALKRLLTKQDIGCFACYNLGTGRGTTSLAMATAFEKASGMLLKSLTISVSQQPYNFPKIRIRWCPRRPGDATKAYAFRNSGENMGLKRCAWINGTGQDKTNGNIDGNQPNTIPDSFVTDSSRMLTTYKPLVFSSFVHLINAMLKIKRRGHVVKW